MAANYNWQTLPLRTKGLAGRRQTQNAHRTEIKHSTFQENRFLPLRYAREPASFPTSVDTTSPNLKPNRPPPIIIDTKHNFRAIQKILPSANLKFKQMSTGTKIFPSTKEDHADVITKLQEHKLEFYTHRTKEDRQFKVFLYGLPKISTEEIHEDLKTRNIEPSEVKEVKTKHSTEDNAALLSSFQEKQRYSA